MKSRIGWLAALAVLAAKALQGQVVLDGTEHLAFDRPEAWAMQYFASLNLLTGFGPPQELSPGSIVIGLEADSVPSLSAAQRRVGFNGTKDEDINRTSIFGRPRITVGLPRQFAFEASYLPPIDISGVEPHLAAIALSRRSSPTRRLVAGLRLVAQHGTFSGDFTCSAREIAEGPNEFDCELPSDDEMTVDTVSLEASIARRRNQRSGLVPYASLGVHSMDLEFLVRADYRGLRDRTLLVASGTTLSMSLGVRQDMRDGWSWAAEAFYSPLDVVRPPATTRTDDAFFNARAMISYRVR